jgi:hypothetical protein
MEARDASMGLLFTLYFYLGNIILLSLFVGILLSARGDDDDKPPIEAKSRENSVGTPSGTSPPRSKSPSSSRPASANPRVLPSAHRKPCDIHPPLVVPTSRPSVAGAGAGMAPEPSELKQQQAEVLDAVDLHLQNTAIFFREQKRPSELATSAPLVPRNRHVQVRPLRQRC